MEALDKDLSNVSDEDFANLGSSSDSSIDDAEDTSSENSDDSVEEDQRKKKKKNIKKSGKKPKKVPKQRIIMNVSDTQYDVVKYVGKKVFGWKLNYDKESMDWDIFWTDWAVQPETLAKMQTFQKINHFPGMYSLARKNHLGRNLMRMKKSFPNNYKFFPQTFLLPSEYNEFRSQFTKNSNKTFIVKPEASCQGRGIFLTKTLDSVQMGEHYVVQRYLQKPYLIDGLKFDMRIYVLLAGCDPLKIFLYDDGLGRFATEEYVAPTGENLENVCMHLTNYAINKDNPNFVFNESSGADDVGHKRSLKAVLRILKDAGHDVDKLWREIKKIIIKTFCSVQPILAHSYRSCHPDEPYNNMCFELLGFDIMLDHKLKPWLIEVNHTPSFTTDTPLDKSIKKSAIRDALKIMNISIDNTLKAKNKKRIELQQRVLTGKKLKLTPEEKKEAFEKAQQERDAWESKNFGRYEKIYPFDDPSQCDEDYEEYMKVANKWWEEWTGLSIKRNTKKVADPNKPPPMVFGSGKAKEIQKTKTGIANQSPNPAQNAKSNQPMPNTEAYGAEKELDEENNAFMAHVAAITGKEAYDVIPEDQEDDRMLQGRNNGPIKSQTMGLSAIQKTEERQDYGDDGKPSSMTTLGTSPENKVGGRGAAFRIKTIQQSKESQKSANENVNMSDGHKYMKKYSNYLNGERYDELQGATGDAPRGRHEREIHTKKVPLKLSNGIVGDFAAGLGPVWSANDSVADAYPQEFETRGGGNILLNRVNAKQNFGKKTGSPAYQNAKPRNYIAPKLLELNVNMITKEEPQLKPIVNSGVSGLSLQGLGMVTKVPGRGMYHKTSVQNVGYAQDLGMQKYYNVLSHQGKR